MKRIFVATIGAALIASPLFASAQAKNFEGFFAEAGLGYGTFNGSFSGGNLSTTGGTALGPYSVDANTVKSIIGVIGGGYNFALTNEFVLGLGGSYSPSRSASATSTITVPAALGSTITGAGAVANIYSIYLSPGYALSQDSLVYGKVGYTGATAVSSGSIPNVNLNGYVLGLGFKKTFDKNLYGFIEGKYASFGSKDLEPNALSSSVTNTGSMSAKGMDILVGVGYKF